ncbi:CAP domain-containing protein [Streptomyces sp. NPDC091272]|uniref:CAP domain-containing protein n=1 Tax=Streptomyces sp. NPDC091272 TaxID=3365981 RepID=UPI003801AB40
MGRHRRTAAGPATEDVSEAQAGGNRDAGRRKKRAVPVRSGLLGVSAAVAFGAVAVASGILPGGDNYTFGGGGNGSGDRVTAGGAVDLKAQGGASASPTDRASAPASARSEERAAGPSKTPAPTRSTPAAKDRKPVANSQKPTVDEVKKSPAQAARPPAPKRTVTPPPAKAPSTNRPLKAPASANDAAAAVLSLVNQERARAGCSPVRPDTGLATLAANFSRDMASRDFFDHTDPDGASPWDRAAKAGIKDLGGENIARGQADAQAVMDAWMKSEGHRANILNCDYTTLGVGVHMGDGGPWWTQDFGF